MPIKRSNHLMVDYELKNLPVDWRVQVRDIVGHLCKEHRLYATSIEVGQFGKPPKILVGIKREGAEEAWTPQVEEILKVQVARALDRARKEEIDRQVGRLHLAGAQQATVAGGLIGGDWALGNDPAAVQRRARRAALSLELQAALKDAQLGDAEADFVGVALEKMRDPRLWHLYAGLLGKIVAVDVALGPELKKRLRELL